MRSHVTWWTVHLCSKQGLGLSASMTRSLPKWDCVDGCHMQLMLSQLQRRRVEMNRSLQTVSSHHCLGSADHRDAPKLTEIVLRSPHLDRCRDETQGGLDGAGGAQETSCARNSPKDRVAAGQNSPVDCGQLSGTVTSLDQLVGAVRGGWQSDGTLNGRVAHQAHTRGKQCEGRQ